MRSGSTSPNAAASWSTSGAATAAEHVWAIGEVAAAGGRHLGLVAPGYAMAEVVADRLLDPRRTRFTEGRHVDQAQAARRRRREFGDAHATTPGALEVGLDDPVSGHLHEAGRLRRRAALLGGLLVGDAASYGTLRGSWASELPGDPESLIAPAGAARWGSGATAARRGGHICSCNNVSKGALVEAITSAAASTVPELETCTRAGTTCGSSVPTLGQGAGVVRAAR